MRKRTGFSGLVRRFKQRWQSKRNYQTKTRRGSLQKKNSFFAHAAKRMRQLKPKGWAILGAMVLLLIAIPVTIVSAKNHNKQPALAATQSSVTTPTPLPTATPIPTPSPTPEPHPSNTIIKEGMTAPIVAQIQERLMDLGYMDADEPTEYFGNVTKMSVQLFQRQHNLEVDGCVGMDTYTLLMSDQAQSYAVSMGAQGTDIKELQVRLRELGYMDDATGFFGESTKAAVIKFQQRNGLGVDGTVGEKTREQLYSEDAKSNYFSQGEVSDKIKTYQQRLQKLGYLTTTPDGKYGDDTVTAVKRFQERNGLIGDGYLGPQTISLLMSSKAQTNALILGMKGDDVTRVQQRLKALNYMKNVTGYFGSETENAIRNFQKQNKLHVDGVVGKTTMNAINSPDAKKASSSSSSSGGSSSGGSSSGGSSSGGSTVTGTGVTKFISVAKSKLGSRYVRGGKGPTTFDCSGFVYWCLNQAGVKQGYMTSASWQKTTKYQRITSMSALKAGDVISYRGHVGIYLGGGQMIDASSSQGKVRITSGIQSSSYWTKNFVAGFRIF